eukprot:6124941-Pyramimonas_sp.AAC.1
MDRGCCCAFGPMAFEFWSLEGCVLLAQVRLRAAPSPIALSPLLAPAPREDGSELGAHEAPQGRIHAPRTSDVSISVGHVPLQQEYRRPRG